MLELPAALPRVGEGGLLVVRRRGERKFGSSGRGGRGSYGRHRSHGSHGSLAIAGTFIGTVIGAGFASGQETLRFFSAFGPTAFAGLTLATVLFIVVAVRVLSLGSALQMSSHRPLLDYAFGRRLGAVFDGLLAVVLLVTAISMASGAAATMAEQFGWPRWLGAALMSVLSVVTVLGGLRGVVAAIASIAPALIVAILVISVYSLGYGAPDTEVGMRAGVEAALAWPGAPDLGAAPDWWLAAVLYVAYNMLLAVPVLAPLGADAGGRGALWRGGMLGGVGLGLGATAIHLAVAAHLPGAAALDIPMLAMARTLPPWVAVLYAVLLLAEIYTTAVAMLFGFAARFVDKGPSAFRLAALAGGVVASAGGQIPFGAVVSYVYPVMGLMGMLLLIGLLRRRPSD